MRGLAQGRQNVVPSPNLREWDVAQAPILMGGPIQGIHQDKCGIEDPAVP
jgi:hypothetical protein